MFYIRKACNNAFEGNAPVEGLFRSRYIMDAIWCTHKAEF